MAETVKVEGIKRHAGIAGQFSVTANVTYPGELTDRIEFVGSVYGGPVAMVLSNGTQTFVTEPDRFGKFGAEWVRRFFGVGASNFPCLNRAYGCARVAVEGRAYCQDHEPADSGWDRGLGELGDRLTADAHAYGSSDGYFTTDETEVHLS